MNVKDYDVFIKECNKGWCNRKTIYNKKTCKTESKQIRCYEKYVIQLEKKQSKFIKKIKDDKEKLQQAIDNEFVDSIDFRWEETKKQVWARDTNYDFPDTYKIKNWLLYCVIWNRVLDDEERISIFKNFTSELSEYYSLSNMHIESRQRNSALKYNVNNIILAGDYFHSLFDNFQDLVTRQSMNNDRRDYWIERFKKYTNNI